MFFLTDAPQHSPEPKAVTVDNTRTIKRATSEAMVLWLRNRQVNGKTLIYSEVCLENGCRALAIRREFRSWARAIEAANVDS